MNDGRELIKRGKTKDVYRLPNGNLSLVYSDKVTGRGNVQDSGANEVIGEIDGVGMANFRLSTYFFEMLNHMGINTHMVGCNHEKAEMEVLECLPFGGKSNVECICRFSATGSFVRRYGQYVTDGQDLGGLFEVTLKDDDAGDPLINEDALQALGILTSHEYSILRSMTAQIATAIRDRMAQSGIVVPDMKLEFGWREGRNGGKEIYLIDEISLGIMRAIVNGKQEKDPQIICQMLFGKGFTESKQAPS